MSESVRVNKTKQVYKKKQIMIDWVTILLALVIIVALVGGFGIVAWKISISDPLTSENVTGRKDDTNQLFDSVNDKKKKDKHGNDQGKKRRKAQKKPKRDGKDEEHQRHSVTFKEPSTPTSDETDNEREESEQVNYDFTKMFHFIYCFILGIINSTTSG